MDPDTKRIFDGMTAAIGTANKGMDVLEKKLEIMLLAMKRHKDELKSCMGELDPDDAPCVSYLAFEELDKAVKAFKTEYEEISSKNPFTSEEDNCVQKFFKALAALERESDETKP